MPRRRHLAALVPAVLLLAWFVLLRPGVLLDGPADYIIVVGASMEPALHSGDLAVVRRQAEYAPGDVVAFNVEGGTVIHRVVGGDAQEGYVVQGDNKNGPDLWRPTPDNIVGRMWFHVPGGGEWLLFFRDPLHFGLIAAGIATIGGAGIGGNTLKRRRRKGGRRMHSRNNNNGKNGGAGGGLRDGLPAPWPLLAALGVAAALTLAFGGLALHVFRQDTERSQFVERLSYEQTGSFDYSVSVERSTLYPTGVVRPSAALAADDGADVAALPFFTRLAHEMELTFEYSFSSPQLPAVTSPGAGSAMVSPLSGELSARLEIQAGDGWMRMEELLAPTRFSGADTSAVLVIDLDEIAALIELVEEETGFQPGTYELRVIPTVSISGEIGGESIAELYEPVFALQYNSTRITPPAALTQSRPVSIGETVTRELELSVLGLSLPVRTWRPLSAGAGLAALAGVAALAAVIFLGVGRAEDRRIGVRYRSMLVPVDVNGHHAAKDVIYVDSMHDLARLAQRDGGIIFHERSGDRGHRYFVPDGDETYEYAIGSEGSPAEAPQEG